MNQVNKLSQQMKKQEEIREGILKTLDNFRENSGIENKKIQAPKKS
jgi:hypothetical protein